MSLPVSQYEALLAEVRDLRKKAQRVQQLARPLIDSADYSSPSSSVLNNDLDEALFHNMDSLLVDRNAQSSKYERAKSTNGTDPASPSETGEFGAVGNGGGHMSVSSEPVSHRNRSSLYHGTWPVERTMWNSEPASLGAQTGGGSIHNGVDVTSVMSFASSSGAAHLDRCLDSPDASRRSSQQLEAKVDMVYSLLAVLGGQEHADMGETLLALSTNPESCLAMRQSGCIPLLVQLVQSEKDVETKKKASLALHNLVHSQTDEKIRKREIRILKLLEQARAYTEALRANTEYNPEPNSSSSNEDGDSHPVQVIAHLMKLSFDEGHRQAICQLGGIHVIATLVEAEHARHGSTSSENHCVLMRRYACMALTNLTFGDSGNKTLLCSFREFMRALVVQLQSPSDELRQVTASVLRNLSWRADSTSKDILREVGSVTGLMKSAMLDNKENTLKSILSALWNLSAHCTENKSEICAVEGALGFLVDMLTYKTPSKSLAIIENSGGILRNISSQIAVRDDYREVLRRHNSLQILLDQLKSPSLTIVSNACGTLWNLSAKCGADQEILWEMGAPAMLRSLNNSKHKMIAMGSSAALKNLLSAKPQQPLLSQLDSTSLSLDLPALPTLGARKQKALLQDLDSNLSELYENIEKESPIKLAKSDKYIPSNDFIPMHSSQPIDYSKNASSIETENISNAFMSLNISEPSTSFTRSTPRAKSRIPQSHGSTSLPYMSSSDKRSSSSTYVSRNKFSDCAYEDEIVSDQPIDYSVKYSETKPPAGEGNKVIVKAEKDDSFYNKPKSDDESFSIYAETDLDQPTDYSLRYAEDDSDSDICNKSSKAEFVQDTVKTYCTEDTPYETPFNFSTATSMSDLRLEDKTVIDNDKSTKILPKSKEIKNEDEKERCSTEDISEIENLPKKDKIPKSEFSSGLMSPEKPINYCEEGTPGYFSRVSSFGSLNSIPVNETLKDVKEETSLEPEVVEKTIVEKQVFKSPAESKVVKFEQQVNYAEETPLMFSRSSSLASLDSIEQHSIHDDRSSVVSDLSRLTSGIVSPSDLPDSPTQTVPPSPKPRKIPIEFPSSSKLRLNDARPQPAPRNLPKPSVFEDNCTKFKEESTPVQFSTATSLSSLTIDDHDEHQQEQDSNTSVEANSVKEESTEKRDAEKDSTISDGNDDLVQESSDDEDILAACINIGMQNNRHNKSKTPSPTPKIPMPGYKYANSIQSGGGVHSSGIPLPKSLQRAVPVSSHSNTPNTSATDTVKTYFTEDTPAILSHAGSNSDLSCLSIPTDVKSKKDYLSDDSSNLSGDNDNILAECIQSGMPKSKITKPTGLPRRNVHSSTPLKYARNDVKTNKPDNKEERKASNVLAPFLSAKDELNTYGIENSPCQFSLRSSLSDLTIDGSVAGLTKCVSANNELASNNQPSSSGTRYKQPLNISQENNASLRDRESLSSISVESLESIEAEQALLEQCISSGMPKSNAGMTPMKPLDISNAKKPVGIATKQFASKEEAVDSEGSKPKNVNVASVVGSTKIVNAECPAMSPAAADVEENQKRENAINEANYQNRNQEALPSKETKLIQAKKSGSNKSIHAYIQDKSISHSEEECSDCQLKDDFESCLERSCELSGKVVDNRMLDPEAMIESLDRFTAELISQASQCKTNEDDLYKISNSENTWNDDTSPNEVTFPTISSNAPNVITFKSDEEVSNHFECDVVDGVEGESNEFSSINTSTMTESTLIAMEANKIAHVFKTEAEMSYSIGSVASLELDRVQPPSNMNSLTNSAAGLERIIPKSPRLVSRKKSLPAGLMIRRALSNSLNHGSSVESLENQSISNLDHINPPSEIRDVFDMEGSMCSVASLPHENSSSEVKADFVINGPTNKDFQNIQEHNPIFNIKHSFLGSMTDLDNMNPPSLFNEITDMCNSLADVPTEAICSETEVFEDCFTHIADTTLQEDLTEFSDANSATPIQSDFGSSSNESTPKKTKSLSKSMNSKQKRNMARDRYKTYTVAAEMVMREEEEKQKLTESISENFETVACSESYNSVADTTYVTPTYTVSSSSKLTPKERRKADKSRFETQVLDEAITQILQQPVIDSPPKSEALEEGTKSPAKTKLSIRQNFMQKRLENKERFKTQTLNESSFSPDVSSVSNGESDMHLLVQQEANLILKTLSETKTNADELLDCETVSLVSNDEDSEHNSGCSINYRTYHKSWGFRKNNVPVIQSNLVQGENDLANYQQGNLDNDPQIEESDQQSEDESEEEVKVIGKPKITKPGEKIQKVQEEPEVKAIRGRRKPLFSKSNYGNKAISKTVKPVKTVNSNLLKNVTSTFKTGTNIKPTANKQNVTVKPPISQSRVSSGYGSQSLSPKTSPARLINKNNTRPSITPPKQSLTPKRTPSLERQGTFTRDDPQPQVVKSKIPAPTSKIPSFTSKIARSIIPTSQKPTVNGNRLPGAPKNAIKSASTDRTSRTNKIYNRSTSADSREQAPRNIQSSCSSQSLKSETSKPQNGAVKKSGIPAAAQRSNSNSSITSTGSAKKQVTSKIASLWKKIEQSKNKVPKNDSRVWIQAEQEQEPPRLIRSNTFDNKDQVKLRNKPPGSESPTKRVSRLGSFIVMDEDGVAIPQPICAANV
ncbi:unnamed protein product [Brassicogethes aeneus]|uniref:Adenomatous polyposis coli protein n=1 Tax=Brassicogethes aeneus TaxID=1431903 RepID=A0A9P0FFM3_BRAAE|nr:unnamed protein product [Brassicogethes aeneus]